MARYNIHWTIATDPTYYGPDATEEDARRCAERTAKEVTAYVYREFPGNLIETHLVPETVSFRYQSWIEDEAGREYQDTDPTGILEAIGEFVTSHWTDWGGESDPES